MGLEEMSESEDSQDSLGSGKKWWKPATSYSVDWSVQVITAVSIFQNQEIQPIWWSLSRARPLITVREEWFTPGRPFGVGIPATGLVLAGPMVSWSSADHNAGGAPRFAFELL